MKEKEFKYSSIVAECSDLRVILITDEKTTATGNTDVHMHSFWEVFLIPEGNLTVKSERENFTLSEGDLLVVPPNLYHSSCSDEGAVKKSVLFTLEKIKRKEDDEPIFSRVATAFSGRFQFFKNDTYAGALLLRILEGYREGVIAEKYRIQADVLELVFHFYDVIKNEKLLHADEGAVQSSYWVYKYAIDRLLDIYYMTDISLGELAKKIFTSPKNVARIISTAYGKSFNELKLELKMRNAKKMLRESDMPISQIAEQIGYTTCRGFLSAFAKYEGTTPSEYRKNARAQATVQ